MRALRVGAVAIGAAMIVAGCGSSGSSSAPDVTGGPASDSATLFKAANLDKVLPKVSSALGGVQVMTVKVEPRDVKVVGQTKTVTVDYNDKSLIVNTPSLPGLGAFDFATVRAAAVERAVSAVESKGKLKQSDISYVAVTENPIDHKPFMGIYLVGSTDHYQANIDGGDVKKIGSGGAGGASVPTPSGAGGSSSGGSSSGGGSSPGGASSSGGGSSSGGSSSGGSSGAASIADCIAKAGNDPAKIKACAGG